MDINDIFKNRKPNIEKLLEFGFKKKENSYFQTYPLLNNQFSFEVCIIQNSVKTLVVDNETNFPYTLYLQSNRGDFSAKIYQEVQYILTMINQFAFYDSTYQTNQSKQIIKYTQEKYGTELEFLFEKFPEYSILRRSDTKKWYGGLFILPAEKLGIKSTEIIEILNLRFPSDEISEIIDQHTFFPGYHMNKNHWISIRLNNRELTNRLMKMIDWSFEKAQ